MKKIRVLHIIAALNGGAGTILLDYSHRMRDLCHFDYAVNYNADFSWNNEMEGKEEEKIFLFPRYYENIIKHTLGIYRIIKAGKYDIVISHVGYASFIPLVCARLLGVKCRVAHSHTSNRPENTLKKTIRLFRGFITKIVATDVCACGLRSAIWTWGRKDYEKGKVKIIRNAIDTNRFSFSLEKRIKYRNMFSIENETIACVCVARLSHEKNQHFLVELWDELTQIDDRYRLFLIGNGDDEKKIKDLIKTKKLEDKIFMMGARQDVSEIINAFDIFLLPSLFEGVPLTLVEAQTNGLPVIASNNVPNEVNVTGLISFGELLTQKWISMIQNCKLVPDSERNCYCEKVIQNHFDIDTESKHIKGYLKERFAINE